ncbi:CBS domain-containing protein [Virgibacillus alimentarius]|uniref:CBS domain-containing protein n=1 Tax=Virgibacillus alimentarius TaxID=698769 RepID=A0ABS4S5N6_9BACI|nr:MULTISPECIES: CBS domain-containing protein [Virgibacillus]MBP2256310.1 CBS domain-containing protein [Virgibacillus alimentarius]HLR66256.1 CBS domain-containing protein [Virgibacillus sp.]
MKIKDFMIKDVISVREDTSVKDLLEILVKHNIGGVPVVSEENTLLGVISDGDVIRYLQPKGRTVYDMFTVVLVSEKEDLTHKLKYSMEHSVKKMMRQKDIYTVSPDEKFEEALRIFSKCHFKKIPVVDANNIVVGVVSRGDIIRFISNKLIATMDEEN